jgi:hypothetical protein
LSGADVGKALLRKILRIGPIYYAIFFIGWGLFPRVSAGPIWYKNGMMFETCNEDWWAVLLFSGNLYPYFSAPNEGCFYWGWIIDVDIQLTIIIPIMVFAYLRSKLVGHLTLAALILV